MEEIDMTNEFDTLQKAPVLTLEPFAEEPQVPRPASQKEEVLDESILTAEEKEAVENFANQIDLTNSSVIFSMEPAHKRKWLIFQRMLLRV